MRSSLGWSHDRGPTGPDHVRRSHGPVHLSGGHEAGGGKYTGRAKAAHFVRAPPHYIYCHATFQPTTVAVSCGYDTCFAFNTCDELCHLTKIMDRVETPFGFQRIIWTFARHTVGRCLIFLALPEVARVMWSDWTNHRHCYIIQLASSSSYLRVNMGCALAICFQVCSLYVP